MDLAAARLAAAAAFISLSCCLAVTSPEALRSVFSRESRSVSPKFLVEVRLRDLGLDMRPHIVERLDLGIDRQTLKLLLNAHPRLRRLELGHHGLFFGLELLDLVLDREQ